MWLHFIFVILIPFSILAWLNTSIYKKLSEQAVLLRRTGQKHLRKREMRLGQTFIKLQKSFKNILDIDCKYCVIVIFGFIPGHHLMRIRSSISYHLHYIIANWKIWWTIIFPQAESVSQSSPSILSATHLSWCWLYVRSSSKTPRWSIFLSRTHFEIIWNWYMCVSVSYYRDDI